MTYQHTKPESTYLSKERGPVFNRKTNVPVGAPMGTKAAEINTNYYFSSNVGPLISSALYIRVSKDRWT